MSHGLFQKCLWLGGEKNHCLRCPTASHELGKQKPTLNLKNHWSLPNIQDIISWERFTCELSPTCYKIIHKQKYQKYAQKQKYKTSRKSKGAPQSPLDISPQNKNIHKKQKQNVQNNQYRLGAKTKGTLFSLSQIYNTIKIKNKYRSIRKNKGTPPAVTVQCLSTHTRKFTKKKGLSEKTKALPQAFHRSVSHLERTITAHILKNKKSLTTKGWWRQTFWKVPGILPLVTTLNKLVCKKTHKPLTTKKNKNPFFKKVTTQTET